MSRMRFAPAVLVSALLLLSLLLSCAPQATPTPPPAQATPTGAATPQVAAPPRAPQATPSPTPRPAPARPAWQSEWEEVVAKGKSEGRLVIYTTATAEERQALTKPFRDKYGIELEFLLGRAGELIQRILTERRAGIYHADMYWGGISIVLTSLKPVNAVQALDSVLLLPEVTSPDGWVDKQLRWIDKDHTVLSFLAYATPIMVVNSNLVKPEEIKSYKDLLHPQWKGKIVMNDPTTQGAGLSWFGVTGAKITGFDYMRELAKQEPVIVRDLRQQAEWLARGKYPIGLAPKTEFINQLIEMGSPLRWVVPPEGLHITGGSGNVVLIDRAPHPSAARVFINWFLTKEGQAIYSKVSGLPSARVDVPTEHIAPQFLIDPKVKYVLSDDESHLLKVPEYAKMARDIFGVK